jgi:hypothetical protein
MNTRPAMVDYLEPEFLHAIGIATVTFALIDSLFRNVFFYIRHGNAKVEDYPDTIMEIHKVNFAARIDKVFSELRKKVVDFEGRGFSEMQRDFHNLRVARNFVAHGVWTKSAKVGEYKLASIDDAGRQIKETVSTETILKTVELAEVLIIQLKSILVNEGFFPPVGPRYSLSAPHEPK